MAVRTNGSGVKITQDNLKDLHDNVAFLLNQQLMVGIPDTNIARDPEPGQKEAASNAVIGWAMEKGDPAKNLPARPFLVPTINKLVEDGTVAKGFMAAGRAALLGNKEECLNVLNRLGIRASTAVKATLDAGNFAPLSPSRLEERIAKLSPKLQKQFKNLSKNIPASVQGAAARISAYMQAHAAFLAANVKILVDTGAMRNAVTWVIRKRR